MTKKLTTPFANNSQYRNDVPNKATQDQTDKGIVGYQDGFTLINKTDVSNGGQPPYMEDINGILYDISGNIVEINKGLPQYFDADYANNIGGYPKGSRLMLDDNSGYVVNTQDGNVNNPNGNMAGWEKTDNNEPDFITEQPIQYYYEKLGNWDDAIFQAQVNVFTKGYSTKLVLPHGLIEIKQPILFNDALYYKIDKLYPDLKIYDKANNKFGNDIDDNYFTSSWCLRGAGKSSQPVEGHNQNGESRSIGGLTCLRFVGGSAISDSSTDQTYMNYGVIHCAPDFIDGRQPKDYTESDKACLSGFNALEISNLNIDGNSRCIHGIVIFGGHFHKLDNMTITDCYGSGIFLNWVFDMNVTNTTFIHCGRVSPTYSDYINAKKFGVQYQTYAPLQITCSNPKKDNSNFIGVNRCHFENNYRVPADIIVGGNSTPVWVTNSHHESGAPVITDGDCQRVCFVPSYYGVAYFGQDSEDNFDYTNINRNQAGGIIISRDCYGYSTNYSHLAYIDKYGQLDISGMFFGADVIVNSNNASGVYKAQNCLIQNLTVNGGFTNILPVELESVIIRGNVNFNYVNNFSLDKVIIQGATTFNNVDLSYEHPNKLIRNVTFNKVDGDVRSGIVENITIEAGYSSYNLINSGGQSTSVCSLEDLEDYLKS